jgi:hypothetical protein
MPKQLQSTLLAKEAKFEFLNGCLVAAYVDKYKGISPELNLEENIPFLSWVAPASFHNPFISEQDIKQLIDAYYIFTAIDPAECCIYFHPYINTWCFTEIERITDVRNLIVKFNKR